MILFWKKHQNIILKILFILFSIAFIIPSVLYLINNKTILRFENYYNFFINDGSNKIMSTVIYLIVFAILATIYLYFLNKKDSFKNIKQILIYIGIVSGIFVIMLPWTSSDIFYYMGVGELNSVYGQNPYYVTIKEYCDENKENVQDDTIMKQGYRNYWSGTTVVYGPMAQLIFSTITKISFKNIDLCLLLFKLVNVIIHLLNCYLIYKIAKKLKFVLLYGLNPYVLLEFIGNVHNDIIVIFFALLSIYFLLNRKKILPSIFFLAIATGIKYFTVLLLPVVILYHFRNEEKISKRFLKCVQYGIIFCGIFILEYAIYFKDMNIFLAMMAQNNKFSKSIYSGIIGLGLLNRTYFINIFGKTCSVSDISAIFKNIVLAIFVLFYIKFCIDLLTTKDVKWIKSVRKYNMMLVLFLLALATFQQWYIVWLFATIAWQRPDTIRSIIGISLASEIANSVYMFKTESFMYDLYFWTIMIGLSIIFKIYIERGERELEKAFINRWK